MPKASTLIFKVLLLCALIVSVEAIILLSPFSRNALGHTYLIEWRAKHARLVGAGHERLILAGGSNVAFGFDSARLERESGRPTINQGLHAGLGLALILREIEDGARGGDAVILFPEYEHFFGDLLNGEGPTAELIQYEPSALRYVSSWKQWRNLMRDAAATNADAVTAVIDEAKATLVNYARRRQTEAPASEKSVYRSGAFDEHGDMVAHLDLESNVARVVASAERLEGNLNEDAFRAIARVAAVLGARGVRFYIVYPSVAKTFWAINRDRIKEVEARLPKQTTLTKPEDWVLADELFYDSAYHLSRRGRDMRTDQLLGCCVEPLRR